MIMCVYFLPPPARGFSGYPSEISSDGIRPGGVSTLHDSPMVGAG